MLLFTQNRVLVNPLIEKGLTFFFTSELEAYKKAREMRSYYYQVFNNLNRHAGYAVPK